MPEALVYIVFFSVSLVTTTFLPLTFSVSRGSLAFPKVSLRCSLNLNRNHFARNSGSKRMEFQQIGGTILSIGYLSFRHV